jgi:hypothetical protein
MAFNFDLEAAVDAIAALEVAISTPTPGIITSYGYNSNPGEITDVSLFPAIVHVNRGEIVPEGTANLFWKSFAETFHNETNKRSLATDSGADEYRFIPGAPSYGLVSWPLMPRPLRYYWGYTYTHRFLFFGGGG